MKNNILMMHVLDVNKKAPFKTLFKMDEAVLKSIEEDMRKNGYDMVHPVVIWGGNMGILIDGHTRLEAATNAGLLDIPVVAKDFEDEEEALEYAIKSQRNRRNLSNDELLKCLTELDKRKSVGRPDKTATNMAIKGRSSEHTAELLGISRGKVEKLRTIKDHGTPEIMQSVSNGDISIDRGYKETIKQRKDNEILSDEDLQKIKQSRYEALKKSPIEMFINRAKRESQEYPQISYSSVELKQLEEYWMQEIKKVRAFLCHQEEQF